MFKQLCAVVPRRREQLSPRCRKPRALYDVAGEKCPLLQPPLPLIHLSRLMTSRKPQGPRGSGPTAPSGIRVTQYFSLVIFCTNSILARVLLKC